MPCPVQLGLSLSSELVIIQRASSLHSQVMNSWLWVQLHPPPPPPSLLLMVAYSSWAHSPEACLFVLVFITLWLSSISCRCRTIYINKRSPGEPALITHSLRMPFRAVLPGHFSWHWPGGTPGFPKEVAAPGPSAWMIRSLPLISALAGRHAVELAQRGRDSLVTESGIGWASEGRRMPTGSWAKVLSHGSGLCITCCNVKPSRRRGHPSFNTIPQRHMPRSCTAPQKYVQVWCINF